MKYVKVIRNYVLGVKGIGTYLQGSSLEASGATASGRGGLGGGLGFFHPLHLYSIPLSSALQAE